MPAPERLGLRVVPKFSTRRVPFVFVCLGILVFGAVAGLLANMAVSQSTYYVESLSDTRHDLRNERERLNEDISYRESPQNITKAAEKLGMKRDLEPQYVNVETGKIISVGKFPGEDNAKHEHIPGPDADTRQDVRARVRPAGGDPHQPSKATAAEDALQAPTIMMPQP